MSLATRCTHCGTIFKVVQDQLKVSEGWVRCGRCHEVFNALPALFDLDSESPPPRRTAQAPAQTPAPTPAPAEPTPPTDHNAWADADGAMAADTEGDSASWTTTRPTELAPPTPISAHTPLSAADLHLAATPLPSATDFDLDTSVSLPLQVPLQVPLSEPRPWDGPPPQDVPDTDESDALDSRYLMPSQDGPRQVKRRPQGPEFADAQFPNDAMLDAEEDWALDSIPAELPAEPAPPTPEAPTAATAIAALTAPPTTTAPPPPSRSLPPAAPLPSASLLRSPSGPGLTSPAHAPDAEDDPSIPTTLPSRFGEDFVREQVQPPPSKRQGRSGTRGRDPATQAPEFVKRAQRQAFWRHPATRGVLLTLLLGLTLGLGLQLAHQFRDLIAAYHPDARPLLQAWCDQVGCKIAPPLRLEVLQVDSATLLRTGSEGPDRYRLTVSVHNRSDIGVAWPHIDLSLTDERGSVIARRAFQATDARVVRGEGAAQPLAPTPDAAPAQQSTTLQWSLRLDGLTPAGYTAELFYP
jgi:predicted Zn finger-like uncharacterized protein